MKFKILVVSVALCGMGTFGRAQSNVKALVERAGAYVESYQREFGSVLSEEHYEQRTTRVVGTAVMRSRDELRSDVLLVPVGPGSDEGWVTFRDVFERNSKPVRDRDQRLADLFQANSADAMQQAQRITDESARYNVGRVTRTINVPTLPLRFLTPAVRRNFDFRYGKPDNDAPGRVVEFTETGRPTVIRTVEGSDLPVSGRFWIDEATGTVTRTEIRTDDEKLKSRITVAYKAEPTLKLWVPSKMEEDYVGRKDGYSLGATANYSKFRKFSVITDETFVGATPRQEAR